MTRLQKLFSSKKDLLSIYYTAGYPQLNATRVVLDALQESGVDFVEIGMPFSDPLADGPVIQQSGTQALQNGMGLEVLLQQLADMRPGITMPVVLMGYLNPVLKFGMERFLERCAQVGVDGLILPDLPLENYLEEYRPLFERYGISNIFLITPQTPEERVRKLDAHSNSFLYMVSSAAVTGAKKGLSDFQLDYFRRIKAMQLQHPAVVGFGISDNESYKTVCQYAQGAIIGSAFVKLLGQAKDLKGEIHRFISEVKNGK
ncbi:tryptophan synthase subunit alpha [Geofilum rhodophaeum]|uniref:tryptophan synthase subunit alpha n=1 Tax=Geofilum rhodophaeum TaxID=1965019 RepID=UPI000B520654|nr:tryptophan synthase subunit alpha [Geofilum rhodophaeum]